MNAIVKALVETGFEGYFRPDHGRMIWGGERKAGIWFFLTGRWEVRISMV